MNNEKTISNLFESVINNFNQLTIIDKDKITNNLINTLKTYDSKTKERINFYDKQIEINKEKIKYKIYILGIKTINYNIEHLSRFNKLKFLKLEEKKLDYLLIRKANRIKSIKKEIKDLKKRLGYLKEEEKEEDLKELKNILFNLKKEEEKRESLRFENIKEIIKIKKSLSDVFDQNFKLNFKDKEIIHILVKKIIFIFPINYIELKKIPIFLIEEIFNLLNNLKLEKEKIKKYFLQEINIYAQILKKDCIISDNLFEIKDLLNNLIKENEKNFKKVFQESLIEYKELLELFNEEEKVQLIDSSFDFNENNFKILQEIKEKINILNPRKNYYIKIINTIKSREELLNKIIEFEKKSSDPKRLKGSSLILFKEEAFRKNMIPKLFIIEEDLLNMIVSYEESFGVFLFKGIKYKIRLKKEISERVLKK